MFPHLSIPKASGNLRTVRNFTNIFHLLTSFFAAVDVKDYHFTFVIGWESGDKTTRSHANALSVIIHVELLTTLRGLTVRNKVII